LRIPNDFYESEEEIEEFQANARFDVDYITVIGENVYLFIQSKWTCEHTAEYEFTLDNSQLTHDHNEEESEE
jgi:glyoxylate carboligase